jgi:hypothetical protein
VNEGQNNINKCKKLEKEMIVFTAITDLMIKETQPALEMNPEY